MSKLNHVLIIPDGNRRYAKQKNIDTKVVYRRISDFTTTELIKFFVISKKLKELSVFGISRNNVLKRGDAGLGEIFETQAYLAKEWAKNKSFTKAGVRFKLVGDLSLLPKEHLAKIKALESKTIKRKGSLVNLLVSYDGQHEILRAIKRAEGKNIDAPEKFYRYLDIKTPIDLIIRTGGEKRFSAAPLYQTSYSEFVFTDYFYPELTIARLEEIIKDYDGRQRRFGE